MDIVYEYLRGILLIYQYSDVGLTLWVRRGLYVPVYSVWTALWGKGAGVWASSALLRVPPSTALATASFPSPMTFLFLPLHTCTPSLLPNGLRAWAVAWRVWMWYILWHKISKIWATEGLEQWFPTRCDFCIPWAPHGPSAMCADTSDAVFMCI